MAEEIYSPDPMMIQQSLSEWVITKCESWRDYYESNYEYRFEEYYRLWRGQWNPEDSQRASERSRIISPALQQAVESNVAELEEATFGRGKFLILQIISVMVKGKMFYIYVKSLLKTLKPVRSERLLPNALLMRLSLELASVKWLLRKLKRWLQRQSQSWVVTFKRLVSM